MLGSLLHSGESRTKITAYKLPPPPHHHPSNCCWTSCSNKEVILAESIGLCGYVCEKKWRCWVLWFQLVGRKPGEENRGVWKQSIGQVYLKSSLIRLEMQEGCNFAWNFTMHAFFFFQICSCSHVMYSALCVVSPVQAGSLAEVRVTQTSRYLRIHRMPTAWLMSPWQ